MKTLLGGSGAAAIKIGTTTALVATAAVAAVTAPTAPTLARAHSAHAAIRVMTISMAVGQAAGVAGSSARTDSQALTWPS